MDREALLGIAQAEREALGRTIQYTPPDRWDGDSACAGWSNRDVIAHLAASEVAAAALLGDEEPSELAQYRKEEEGFTLDGFNDRSVSRRRELSFRQVVSEWGRAADLLLARASKVSEEDWSAKRVAWVAGDLPIRFLVQSRVSEWWIHGEDVRAGGGNQVRLEHWPIHAVNDLAIRTLPYALGQAGRSFPGRSVHVELEGAGGGSWHYGLAPREVPHRGKRPDAYIDGRGYPFAMIAARRIPAERYLDDGTIAVGGDEDLALEVLEHVRAFA
ncbi:MAG: maleylpyruvate isomerase family mycothiol-dependent enzyme [Actinobacteria bacterium]|nr:maleylpyruvate isomerase family mycothiol-dependent enzyme [Actinomycetota bacterium]